MAARRLLIVMLVLLGLSTLAAALVPQHGLRGTAGTGSTTTTTASTTTTAGPPANYLPPTKIKVGGKKLPVVSPLSVGQQIILLVQPRVPTQLSIPAFGLFGFAAPDAPARFDLLPSAPGTFGVLFEPSGEVAAQIRVVPPNPAKKKKGKKKKKGR